MSADAICRARAVAIGVEHPPRMSSATPAVALGAAAGVETPASINNKATVKKPVFAPVSVCPYFSMSGGHTLLLAKRKHDKAAKALMEAVVAKGVKAKFVKRLEQNSTDLRHRSSYKGRRRRHVNGRVRGSSATRLGGFGWMQAAPRTAPRHEPRWPGVKQTHHLGIDVRSRSRATKFNFVDQVFSVRTIARI